MARVGWNGAPVTRCFPNYAPRPPSRRQIVNVEPLAIEDQEPLSAEQTEDPSHQQTAEITPLPPESFKLIGGGSGIVVF